MALVSRDKPDPPLSGRLGRYHQLADGVEHDFELRVIPGFELVKSSRKNFVRGNHLSQTHKGPHDSYAHLHCSLATQDIRGHQRTVLRKHPGAESGIAVLL